MQKNLIISIDAGTSVIKSVVFTDEGNQIAIASVPNVYTSLKNGFVTQNLQQTWDNVVQTIQCLHSQIANLADHTLVVAVTGQGDGTFLLDKNKQPLIDGFLWLDSRASHIAKQFCEDDMESVRYNQRGSGTNACQQGVQLTWIQQNTLDIMKKIAHAMHCKDWLYYNLTDEIATDISEMVYTFGNYRTRTYDDTVISSFGLSDYKHILPPAIDCTNTQHSLSQQACRQIGLKQGTPVILGPLDVVCTAVGAMGINTDKGCSILGSTSMHVSMAKTDNVVLDDTQRTGYVMTIPGTDYVFQCQSSMAATLNIDWLVSMVIELFQDFGQSLSPKDVLNKVDDWLANSMPAESIYHPYISFAGERGPFMDSNAQASLIGCNQNHNFAQIIRTVIEGISYAAKECYQAAGNIPNEITISGGMARSEQLCKIFSSVLNVPVCRSTQSEAGAAGLAMIASVAMGINPTLESCNTKWITPYLGTLQYPNKELVPLYAKMFCAYKKSRVALQPVWPDVIH